MATTLAPYGLKPINLLGGQSYAGSTRLYAIPASYAVNIQVGDPVIIVNTGSTRGTLARFNATTTATTAPMPTMNVFLPRNQSVIVSIVVSPYWTGSVGMK